MKQFVVIHSDDDVGVALMDLPAGTVLEMESASSTRSAGGAGDSVGAEIVLLEEIPKGHKFALRDLGSGQPVIKYGMPIGKMTASVAAGAHVHTHNLATGLSDVQDYSYDGQDNGRVVQACLSRLQARSSLTQLRSSRSIREQRTFQGFRRADGRVGVRNEIWIIPTVGCVNNIVEQLAERAKGLIGGSLEEIVAFPHPYGCSQMGDDQEMTRKALAALARHPNCAGVLMMGLGCENSSIPVMKAYLEGIDPAKIRFVTTQEVDDEFAEGMAALTELAAYAKTFERGAIDASELIVGLKCGGSDGLSGITANPLVGYFSDALVGMGGSTILTEVPEMFGAEQLLMRRAGTEEVFAEIVRLINDFKQYYLDHGQAIYENPSPGNKAGGISTLEDKSLGCVQKGGSSAVEGVLQYAEPVRCRGLQLLQAPGNDLVSSTALALSGAQIVLFTTGRGTPFASPVPTIKLSSNSQIYEKKRHWIDFDAGQLLASEATMEEVGEELVDYVFAVASGERVRAEINGFHDMSIFKSGVTL